MELDLSPLPRGDRRGLRAVRRHPRRRRLLPLYRRLPWE